MDGKFKLTFTDAFRNGDTHNGVMLSLPPYPRKRNSFPKANFLPKAHFLPNTTLSPDFLPDPPDGQWTGMLVILTDDFGENSCKVIDDFTISVDFAEKRIEGRGFFKAESGYPGFCLNGKFNNHNNPRIHSPDIGKAAFGISNGTDTLEYADNTRTTLRFIIGKKGAVGYFVFSEDNCPRYAGGFVARPPE